MGNQTVCFVVLSMVVCFLIICFRIFGKGDWGRVGSFDKFKQQFTTEAVPHFGNGWAWLAQDKKAKQLKFISTHDAANPMLQGLTPLFYIRRLGRLLHRLQEWPTKVYWQVVGSSQLGVCISPAWINFGQLGLGRVKEVSHSCQRHIVLYE